VKRILISALFLIFFFDTAYAYIDPGLGSYILQILLAGLLGGLYLLRQYWAKVKSLMKSLFRRDTPDAEN